MKKTAIFDRKLDEAISAMSNRADDFIATLRRKLEDLKKKNSQLDEPVKLDFRF